MSGSRLQAILDTTVDGIILMDQAGVVTMFNPACERMFGYSAAEAIGENIKQLMPPPFHEEHDRYLANYRRTGLPKIIGVGREVVGRRRSGETFPLDLSVGEATHEDEVFYVGILRDLTARQREIETRERLIEQLTDANEDRTHFAQVASHDLREPLRMVAAFCGLLSKSYGDRLDDRGREYLGLAISATKQMQDLVDDLVDFGRLGLEAERSSWFATDEVLDRVVETLQEAIREAGAEITRSPLPKIFGNPIRFHRLMQNLIGNALKYVAAGAAPRVRVAAAKDDQFWTFSVADNGIGIEERHFKQIFEPFKRLHVRDRYYGSGLGLAICRKIVDGFGGRIWVQSVLGQGSTFSFTARI